MENETTAFAPPGSVVWGSPESWMLMAAAGPLCVELYWLYLPRASTDTAPSSWGPPSLIDERTVVQTRKKTSPKK